MTKEIPKVVPATKKIPKVVPAGGDKVKVKLGTHRGVVYDIREDGILCVGIAGVGCVLLPLDQVEVTHQATYTYVTKYLYKAGDIVDSIGNECLVIKVDKNTSGLCYFLFDKVNDSAHWCSEEDLTLLRAANYDPQVVDINSTLMEKHLD